MFCAVARLFRPGYVDALVLEWLPGLDGVIDKRKTGATVADGENINPVEGLYYSASTMICVPTSIAQETGLALGAQAGEKRRRTCDQQNARDTVFLAANGR